jgi:hypothetical protein
MQALRRQGFAPYPHELKTGGQVGLHTHPTIEVRVCCRGRVQFLVNEKKYVLGPGDRIEMPPYAMVEMRVLKGPALLLCASR